MDPSAHPARDRLLDPPLAASQERLFERLRDAGPLLVAYSGGVDSSYLAWATQQARGRDFLAVTALSSSYPRAHREMAEQIVASLDMPHRFVETREMESASYRANRPDRCYHCKSELFTRLDALREELDFGAVAYGINADDVGDYRPGHRAADEHAVLSPLLDVGLTKAQIRTLSQAAELPTWDLPASACLSSRLPYGTEVTPERLAQVEEGEARLHAMGFRQVRLRHHGELARVEIDPREMKQALDPERARAIVEAIKPLGFRWVSLDLEGYRMGSLNEVLFIQSDS